MRMPLVFVRGTFLSASISRTCPTSVFCSIWRSFKTNTIAFKDTTASEFTKSDDSDVDVSKLIDEYEKKVDKDRLSETEKQIHRSHMKALQVSKNPGQGLIMIHY